MGKSSLQLQGSHPDSAMLRGLKQYVPRAASRLRTKTGSYVAEFHSGFCVGAKPGDLIEQIDTLLHTGQVIKDGDTCHVSRLVWNYKDVVVKRYNHKGLIHSLRHTIKKSRARKAWLHARRLGALNLATPKPVAYVEHRRGLLVWQSYLVTEYVDGQMLYDFVRDDTVAERQQLDAIRQAVELLDEFWKHGITHGDLKHTNVLVTDSGPVLTDLDAMAAHRWTLFYRSRQRKDAERFLKKTDVSPELHEHCRTLISNALDSSKKLMNDFDTIQEAGWTIRARKDLPKNVMSDLLSFADSSGGVFARVQSSDYSEVFRGGITFDGADHVLYMKKHLCRSVLDSVKHIFRPSRARRAFNASLMLRQNGIDAPDVMGLFERRFGPFCADNSLLTEEVEGGRSMVDVLNGLRRDTGAGALARRRSLIRAFAETVGRMHARGIFHGDLRLGNVLVVQNGASLRFFFIDNERTKKFHRLPSRLRLKNLVQVNLFIHGITDTDRLRFFRAYLAVEPSIQRHYRRWAEKVIAKTNERLSRKDWLDS
ncbi:MAG: lipopolysaccharide kinase InaA family protein [Planctomycetota bacterium]